MICYHNHSIREMTFHPPIFRLLQLPSYRSIATYSNHSWTPPLCQSRNEDSEGLFRQCHISIVEILVVPIQRYPKKLRDADSIPVSQVLKHRKLTYEKQHDRKYVIISKNRSISTGPPCLISPPGCPSTAFPFVSTPGISVGARFTLFRRSCVSMMESSWQMSVRV